MIIDEPVRVWVWLAFLFCETLFLVGGRVVSK